MKSIVEMFENNVLEFSAAYAVAQMMQVWCQNVIGTVACFPLFP